MPVTFETTRSAADNFFTPPLAERPGAAVLLNHPAQSATTIDGWAAVIFGVPFMAIGGFIGWMMYAHPATTHHAARHAANHAFDWMGPAIAGMFFLAGAFVFLHGVRGLIRKAVYNRHAAARPNEPWLYDHHWRREGIAFSAFDDMVKRLIAAVVWTAFLVPFAWIGVTQRGAWPFLVAVGILGLLGVISWVRWAQALFDFLRHGNSFLTYSEFPYALGGKLSARLRIRRDVAAIDELRLTLRCIQEQYVTTGIGQNRASSVVCYELYSESATLGRERLNGLIAGEIPVEFKISSDQPATTLIATPPTYWEIEAKGKAGGADYQAYFLVPIYRTS
jgi:hypothetical protein